MDEISDYKMLKAVKAKIEEHVEDKLIFKALYHCGEKVPLANPGVAIMKNDKKIKIVGNAGCKSPWCCPVCTAHKMAKYSTDIGCAIDALKKQNQVAAMFTFTIPHTRDFSCYEVTEILYTVWKKFTVRGNKGNTKANKDIFSSFAATFNHKHRIRVCEYTYGEHGWHPHFHALFWFAKSDIDKILEWEEILNARWYELAKRETIKMLMQRKNADIEKTTARVNHMYANLNEESKGVHISKADNKVIVQESSMYICGWGADKELTGNYNEKATHEHHYTWQQILKNAIETKDEEESRKWWNLYFEYAKATKRNQHARINYSVHSGIKAIIANWKQSQEWKQVLKKKRTSQVENQGKWTMVCWFTRQQWSELYQNNVDICKILELAMHENGYEQICKYLEEFRLSPPYKTSEWQQTLENLMNNAA